MKSKEELLTKIISEQVKKQTWRSLGTKKGTLFWRVPFFKLECTLEFITDT